MLAIIAESYILLQTTYIFLTNSNSVGRFKCKMKNFCFSSRRVYDLAEMANK